MEYSFLVEHSDEMYWWENFMLQSSLNITNKKGFYHNQVSLSTYIYEQNLS
jgi:hypothetical protein